MRIVRTPKCSSSDATSCPSAALARIGLAALGLTFGMGFLVASNQMASAISPTTLYVDNVDGTATTGCTAPGASACKTIQEGVTAAESLGSAAVTVDVAGSATFYDEKVTINLPTSSDSLDLEGTGTMPPTINDAGSRSMPRWGNTWTSLRMLRWFTPSNSTSRWALNCDYI